MKIIVVEDEAPIRRLCERALTQAGYACATAASGEEALKKLSADCDLVLTDLTMPGEVDGLEVLRQTKARTSADVILMTGFPELDSAVKAMRDGAYDYLIKPVSLDGLILTVDRCLEKRRLSAELSREKALRTELERAHLGLLQLEKVKETFGRFVTPEVVRLVLEKPADILRKGERRTVSTLFADVRGFTPFAGRVSPEEVVETVNEVFEIAVEEINAENGAVNQFLGDGLMAVFGAPMPLQGHAACAARAALKAGLRLNDLRDKNAARGREPLEICIGVHTGEVVAGCLGTKERTEYRVVGHAVNLASRIEGANRFFGSRVLVSAEVYARVENEIEGRALGPIRVLGYKAPLVVFELVDFKKTLNAGKKAGLNLFARGRDLFLEGRYRQAASAFESALSEIPDDAPARSYLRFCEDYAAAPPKGWDGVFTLTSK